MYKSAKTANRGLAGCPSDKANLRLPNFLGAVFNWPFLSEILYIAVVPSRQRTTWPDGEAADGCKSQEHLPFAAVWLVGAAWEADRETPNG